MTMEQSSIKSVCHVSIKSDSISRIVVNAMRGSNCVEYGSPLMFIPNFNTDFYKYLCYIYFVVKVKRYFTISVDVFVDPAHFGLASDHYEIPFNGVYFIFDRIDG